MENTICLGRAVSLLLLRSAPASQASAALPLRHARSSASSAASYLTAPHLCCLSVSSISLSLSLVVRQSRLVALPSRPLLARYSDSFLSRDPSRRCQTTPRLLILSQTGIDFIRLFIAIPAPIPRRSSHRPAAAVTRLLRIHEPFHRLLYRLSVWPSWHGYLRPVHDVVEYSEYPILEIHAILLICVSRNSFILPGSACARSPTSLKHVSAPENHNSPTDFSYLEQLYINPEAFDPPSPPHKPADNDNGCAKGYSGTTQLLSPVLTNTPSPSAISNTHPGEHPVRHDQHDANISPTSITHEGRKEVPTLRLPTLATTPYSNAVEVKTSNYPELPPSPVVKISSYSRGDSPSRDEVGLNKSKRKSISSVHLAPGADASDEPDDGDEHDDKIDDCEAKARAMPSSPTLRAADGSWVRNPATGLGGLDPSSRTEDLVPSLKEITAQQELEVKIADVERWLSFSEANSEVEDNTLIGYQSQKKWRFPGRRRTKSTGDSPLSPRNPNANGQQATHDTIPGPGVLVIEESEEDEDDSHSSDSSLPRPPDDVDSGSQLGFKEDDFPPTDTISLSSEVPLPRQFIRSRPWQDQPRNQRFGDMKEQPPTSSAAIYRFLRQADNTDTASRRATWGTREVTEADVESLRFESMRINDDGMKEKFSPRTLFGHASKLIPRRSHSGAKRKHSILTHQTQPSVESLETGKSGPSSSALPQRKPSFTRRSKTPSNTSGAFLEMGRQIASVGVTSPIEVQPTKPLAPWSSFMRRSRSRSEVPKGLQITNSKVTQPVPGTMLAAPLYDQNQTAVTSLAHSPLNGNDTDENDHNHDEDEEDLAGDRGVFMDFSIRGDLIVPTLEGFKSHVEQLNPRLQPALVQRIAQEQMRRYKKLVELKLKHAQAVHRRTCPSREHCFAQGGDATILLPKTGAKDVEAAAIGTSHIDPNGGSGENAVTDAMFPSGVPLPPTRRLPAKFECSLCFEVKKFQKPSDWTKHVHEDIQPFTCTFPECPEPKSFKRKADWVRHENERHRHLEWWACNMLDCTHVCYRKDNFVQHLVREHKMPEPRVNRGKGRGGPIENASPNQMGDDTQGQEVEKTVWDLVESCRQVTTKQPTEEACRFCGNVCNSWKKLTVHLAKHMEQIAMPVLQLVEERAVLAGNIPVEGGSLTPAPSSFPKPLTREQSTLSTRSKTKNSAQGLVYGTAALLPEAFAVKRPTVSAKKLQMHNALMGSQQYSMSSNQYAVQQPYSQGNSPVLQGPRHSPLAQRQYGGGNGATYPPPFNAPIRQPGAIETPNTGEIPYTLDVDLSAATDPLTGFGGGPLYASPVEHYSYTTSPTGMGYHMEASGSGQGYGYINIADEQRQYGNQ
ncbi:predicted protein [Uncinocarpus reesii 1704]|uniref:C2H2-type domain-containing protein n=1 Tax=Uncinocarpus reesii (strain UAMH 1704) TaxID=336963 RepID=C4JIG3_UNCRE|nr:uncharacterized protein UREG_01500 [Uncinocarpus reesii 1704]EEP76651.1 predicted protein [Uncinocarpus reesii 1704]